MQASFVKCKLLNFFLQLKATQIKFFDFL